MAKSDYVPDDTPIRVLVKLRRERYNQTFNMHCPLLKDTVYFNREGFFHATHDGRAHRRSQADARMRLNLLPSIYEVIERAKDFAKAPEVMPKTDPRNTYDKEVIFYELISQLTKTKSVIVVLRKIGNGRLHYYSVRYAAKKQKQTR